MTVLKGLGNEQLLVQLHELVRRDHSFEAELIAHLGEVEARRLYLEQACPSMFDYCVRVLRFAEGVAYKRIAVARAARRFPVVLAALGRGELHLTAASLIAPHLADGNAAEWLAVAQHATAREIKQRIADRQPKAEPATSVRRLPPLASRGSTALETRRPPLSPRGAEPLETRPAPTSSARPGPRPSRERARGESGGARCEPLGAERYCIRFVADQAVHAQLQELRALLRHSIPDGDVAKILARAVAALHAQVRKRKLGATASPRAASAGVSGAMTSTAASESASTSESSGTTSEPASAATASKSAAPAPSRHIPVAIRRAVWARDAGCCSYVSRQGRRCGSREHLEFHHQEPWARCREHVASNIHLRCRAHNQYEAERVFGSAHMARYRKRASARRVEEAVAPE